MIGTSTAPVAAANTVTISGGGQQISWGYKPIVVKPVTIPVTTSVIKPVTTPVTTSVIKPVTNLVTTSVIKPVTNLVTTSVIKPVTNLVTTPVVKPVTTPVTTPVVTPPVTTPVTIPSGLPTALTAMEQQMVTLVNQDRVKLGLKPLAVDMRLVKAARLKSQDMIDKHYTSHISPTYGSPFDMMKSMGITYNTAGENIAGAATVDRAYTNLMNSAGHRSNILSPNYTKIGIGIIQGGPYGLMITQLFIG